MAAGSDFFPIAPETVAGDTGAMDAVYRSAFSRLRSIAQRLLSRERAGCSLPPTALVNESYLKVRSILSGIESDAHFFHVSARAMKQVLIDRGRVRGKRRIFPIELLNEAFGELTKQDPEVDRTLMLKVAWERLRALDPLAAEAIRLRCVEGRTIEEAAQSLGRTPARVRVDYEYGLKWMASQLGKRS